MSDAPSSSPVASSWKDKLCFWRGNGKGDDSSNVGLVVFLTAVVVIALLGYFTSRAALSVEMVNARLSAWGDVMKESAARKGYDASFTYGTVSIEGGLFSKRAVVADPKLTLSRNNKLVRSFTTSVFEIQPDTGEMEKLRLVFAAPLTMKLEDEASQRFEAVSPIEVEVTKVPNGQAYEAFVPTQVNIFKGGDGADSIPSMTFETKLGSKVTGFIGSDSEEYTQHITLLPSTLKMADRTMRVASLDVTAEAAKEDAARMTHYEAKIGKFETTGIFSVITPLDIVADVDRETASVLADDEQEHHKDNTYFFNALSMYSGTSELKLTGKFDVAKGEILPMGSAEVSLSNVGTLIGRLKAAGTLDDRSVDVSRAILKRIASEWNTKTDTIQFSVEREYGGGFYLGDVTFEELLATALKQYLLGVTQPEVKAEDDDSDNDATQVPAQDILSNGGLEHDAATPAEPAKDVQPDAEDKQPKIVPIQEGDKTEKNSDAASSDVNVNNEPSDIQIPDESVEPEPKSRSLLDRLFSSKKEGDTHMMDGHDAGTAMESLDGEEPAAADKPAKQ